MVLARPFSGFAAAGRTKRARVRETGEGENGATEREDVGQSLGEAVRMGEVEPPRTGERAVVTLEGIGQEEAEVVEAGRGIDQDAAREELVRQGLNEGGGKDRGGPRGRVTQRAIVGEKQERRDPRCFLHHNSGHLHALASIQEEREPQREHKRNHKQRRRQ